MSRTSVIMGLLVVTAIAAGATILPRVFAGLPAPIDHIPLSPVLVAILLGLALAGASRRRPEWTAGLNVAAGPLFKLAVMLIGLRLSLSQLGELGLQAVPLAAGALASGLGLAWLLGRWFGVDTKLTALLAVGAAICGVSAIAAAAPALKTRPEQTAYALACIVLLGLAATLLYPWLLFSWLPDSRHVGLVLGAAIQDTAQVTAAALMFEQTFGHSGVLAAATVTKLLRNLSMMVVIPVVLLWALRGEVRGGTIPAFPLFILGFLVLAAIRSGGDLLLGENSAWLVFLEGAEIVSAFLFAMAMAAIGMSIRPAALHALGPRPALAAPATTLGMGMVALLLVHLVT